MSGIKQYKNLPLALVILDGWGEARASKGNAISLANISTISGLSKKYPSGFLYAHGKYVGLPKDQVGNSEAGHMNIGAGRIVKQDSVRISEAINDRTFYKNSAFLGAIRHIKKMNSKMHIMGMLSNGQSPHSDPGHLLALLKLMKDNYIEQVYLHLFTDGRDSPKYVALKLVDDLEKKGLGNFKIASIMGRYYAMDRKKKWSNTKIAFNALTKGEARQAKSAKAAITEAYNRGESDEFIEPYIVVDENNEKHVIEDGDSVIFFNLRSDRGRQLTKSFVQNRFKEMNPGSFKRSKKLNHLFFVAMTDFGPDLDDLLTAYPGVDLTQTLPMQLKAVKQLYLAETEKYAHVTYFFNGGYSGRVSGEDQIMLSSPDVKSYDMTPAMKTKELSKKLTSFIDLKKKKWKYDFALLNIAAPDMIGHTGNIEAGIKCCEIVDSNIAKIVKAYLAVGGTVIITADHGNIEKMLNLSTGEIHTEHTTNKVPFIVVNKKYQNKISIRKNGTLGDIAPTILHFMGFKLPKEMSKKNLIVGTI